jgi:hypothetical protein
VITESAALAFRKHRCENTPCLARIHVLVMGYLMTMVAPKPRKPLSADALFGLVRNSFAHIPDARLSETAIA